MALLNDWRALAYNEELGRDRLQQFWAAYFQQEKAIYQVLLKNPDEVWINKFKKELDNVNFIKYYKGRVINVICRQKNLKYKVHTWFEIKLNSEDVKEYRSGLLIKK